MKNSHLRTDCVVVGAGIVGLAIANELINQKYRVTLVHCSTDQKTMASYAAGAMLGAFGEVVENGLSCAQDIELEFRVTAARMYSDWLEQTIDQTSEHIIKKGTFVIANNFGRSDRQNLSAIERALNHFQTSYDVVEQEDIPGYRPSRGYELSRAIFVREECFIDLRMLMNQLLRQLQKNKNCTLIDARATAINCNHVGELTAITLDDGIQIFTDQLILATGLGTYNLLKSASVSIKCPGLIAGKGVGLIVDTDLDIPYVLRSPNRDFACGIHVVPQQNRTMYIGATNRTASVPGTNCGVSVEELHDILHEAVNEINTGLESGNVISLLSGSRPLAYDSVPIVGETNVKGLYVASGTYRNGVLLAPLIAKCLVAEIQNRPIERWRCFSPLSYERKVLPNIAELVRRGAESVVSFLPQPHGKLPYNRSKELSDVLEVLFLLMLNEHASAHIEPERLQQLEKLRKEAVELIIERPMVETFAQLYYKFHTFNFKSE